jgi:ACT domain-containing protein
MPSSYTIIDNIPQNKKPNNMNVVMINQLIEGFDTVQNTLENIDNTNKYNVELNYKQVPILLKPEQTEKSGKYMAIVENHSDKDETKEIIEYIPKKQPFKMDMVTSFYVGSLSVVGLFILYRFIQKSK